eukprot:TRINITY_DN5576_c1_g1_i1.p1 TRINITY_DN5576_c1_g1~~TRINITY_DN5576_c1_g1_i1.p1  ORF type:complete len:173 (+),score=29.84 TRINITY_DN5576_c1_g1_i1:52-519(+)
MHLSTWACWGILFASISLELCGTFCMKLSGGYNEWLPSVLMFVFYIACLGLMPFALSQIELSVAYAVWSGVGTAASTAVGIVYFKESVTVAKLVSVAAIIGAVVALKFTEHADSSDSTSSVSDSGSTATASSVVSDIAHAIAGKHGYNVVESVNP